MTIREVSREYGISQATLRYYERVGMIPPVTRADSGNRDYQEKDLEWVELVKCMRGAGLTVEAIIRYVRLCQVGDATIKDRLELLEGQRELLLAQREQIDTAVTRLNHKISRYEEAARTGVLTWDSDHGGDSCLE